MRKIMGKLVVPDDDSWIGRKDELGVKDGELRIFDGVNPGGDLVFNRRLSNGWAVYADATTTASPIQLVAGEWNEMTIDGLGSSTQTNFLPTHVTKFWDTSINRLVFSELEIGTVLAARFSFTIIPEQNNTAVEIRVRFTTRNEAGNPIGTFSLIRGLSRLNDGAGIQYQRSEQSSWFIGSEPVRLGDAALEIKSSAHADLIVHSLFIYVTG